jgi:hypothetical protein
LPILTLQKRNQIRIDMSTVLSKVRSYQLALAMPRQPSPISERTRQDFDGGLFNAILEMGAINPLARRAR